MAQPHVSIIGAGIGGLTLGRCLLKRKIPAILYERGSSSPRHGYGITLHAATYRPLMEALGMNEATFRKRVAVDAAVGGDGDIDTRNLVHVGRTGPGSFRAHRGRLETLLREGLEIRWDHAVSSLEATPSGSALVFENGQRIEQRFIVGAEGVHANSRKSLLPNKQPNILPLVAFNGKRRVKRDVFEELYAPALKASSIIETRHSSAILHISVNDVVDDIVSISWVYSRAARNHKDPLYTPNRQLSDATITPQEFYDEISSLRNLDQPFIDVFDVGKLKSERILSWLMRIVEIDLCEFEDLARNGVLLIGDAAHAQPILGGEGANAAMLDGMNLAGRIATDPSEAAANWHGSQFALWKEGVDMSKNNIQAMHAQSRSSL